MLSVRKNKDKLYYLNSRIHDCECCKRLHGNGIAVPYWSLKSKYMILAEAPGEEEVQIEHETPLIGRAGRFCFTALNKYGFERDDFLIINTIQHRPVVNGKNGKPKYEEIDTCRFWVEKYMEFIEPEIILAFGNYALYYLFGETSGIMNQCGTARKYRGIKVIPCLHPASVLYNQSNRNKFLRTIKLFKEEAEKK